jgi:hypothetical protein
MVLTILIAAAAWLLVTALVVGLCLAAKRGDATLEQPLSGPAARRALPRGRAAHPASTTQLRTGSRSAT